VRIRFLKNYRDRYGVEHKEGDVAELRDLIAAKIVAYKIAVFLPSVAEEDPEPAEEPTAGPEPEPVAEEDPEPAKRGPGRPRKA
jgi:hypothetical protein